MPDERLGPFLQELQILSPDGVDLPEISKRYGDFFQELDSTLSFPPSDWVRLPEGSLSQLPDAWDPVSLGFCSHLYSSDSERLVTMSLIRTGITVFIELIDRLSNQDEEHQFHSLMRKLVTSSKEREDHFDTRVPPTRAPLTFWPRLSNFIRNNYACGFDI